MKALAPTSAAATAQNCHVTNGSPGCTGALPPGLSSRPANTMYAITACTPTTMR